MPRARSGHTRPLPASARVSRSNLATFARQVSRPAAEDDLDVGLLLPLVGDAVAFRAHEGDGVRFDHARVLNHAIRRSAELYQPRGQHLVGAQVPDTEPLPLRATRTLVQAVLREFDLVRIGGAPGSCATFRQRPGRPGDDRRSGSASGPVDFCPPASSVLTTFASSECAREWACPPAWLGQPPPRAEPSP